MSTFWTKRTEGDQYFYFDSNIPTVKQKSPMNKVSVFWLKKPKQVITGIVVHTPAMFLGGLSGWC